MPLLTDRATTGALHAVVALDDVFLTTVPNWMILIPRTLSILVLFPACRPSITPRQTPSSPTTNNMIVV